MKRGKFNIIIGGQAGSEAKGKLSSYLVRKFDWIDIVAGSFGPNAGHTAWVGGKKYVSHHFPVGAAGTDKVVIVGPEAVIRPIEFWEEANELELTRVLVDRNAAVVGRGDEKEGEERLKYGRGTGRGVSNARARKIRREGNIVENMLTRGKFTIVDTGMVMRHHLRRGGTVLYEMTQGFDLCIDHGIEHAYSTSRIINPMMALAEMGVPVEYLGDVYGVIRPYPIRINSGEGYSGPYGEAKEITWAEVAERCGAKQDITEITTTTKRVRRVFEFSHKRFARFLDICDPNFICLNFANYIDWKVYGKERYEDLTDPVLEWTNRLVNMHGITYSQIGTGPGDSAMIDLCNDDPEDKEIMEAWGGR